MISESLRMVSFKGDDEWREKNGDRENLLGNDMILASSEKNSWSS